jgi:hypothetical protein
MENRKAYIDKMATQLKRWDDELQQLKTIADRAKADAKTEYYRQIDDLRTKKENAQLKLNEVRNASDEAWGNLKAGLEKSWSTFKTAFDSAKAEFK